jgi:hypothetical protein
VVELTVNALLELPSSVIWTGEVPEFLMEIFCEAPVPIFTSPKSMSDGVATTGSAFAPVVDENARELEPHPANPRLSSALDASATMTLALQRCERPSNGDWLISRLTGDFSLVFKKEEVRALIIRSSPTPYLVGRCRNPAEPAAGKDVGAASIDYQQNRPCVADGYRWR